ncbi:MAG: Hsp20/alpha crystallin family protein [Actinomycetota bacterium]|nr:Hsp20/alpha crystallin family protein [Actinomycetota bacterium]
MALPVLRRNHAVEQKDESAQGWSPPVDRWSPWAEFTELYERMGRLLTGAFDEAFGEQNRAGAWWRPAADVEETPEAYVVELELPGVKRKDVSVEFDAGELAVTGEVKERERVGFLRTRTRPVGRFDYRISLPADVVDDQITASLSDGVLTVQVPKTEKARPRKIPISS